MNCPECKMKIPEECINTIPGFAVCEACDLMFPIAVEEAVGKPEEKKEATGDPFDFNELPDNMEVKREGNKLIILAYRPNHMIVVMINIIFCLFSVLFPLAGCLSYIFNYKDPGPLFIFILCSPLIFLFLKASMSTVGSLKVTLDETSVTIFKGFRKFGVTKIFSSRDVFKVNIETRSGKNAYSDGTTAIVLTGKYKIPYKFAHDLKDDQNDYILKVLKHYCLNKRDDWDLLDDDLSEHLID